MQDYEDLVQGAPAIAPSPARLTERVRSALHNRISTGQYPRRTRLPSERELAIEFNVSRPVVRSALARLRHDGLVESIKGSGTVVLREPASTPDAPGGGATVRDLQRCFEFRLLIEAEAAFHASLRAMPTLLDAIRGVLDAHDEALRRGETVRGQSFDFHRSVALASDNPYYVSALDFIADVPAFRIYLGRSYRVPDEHVRLAKVSSEHRHIFELIERREAGEARSAMRAHIESARDKFMECLPLVSPMPPG
jgi:GntR family transcriptional repressor for pyruvate dehydrogenase complex